MINEGASKPKVKLWNECNAEAYLENFEYSKVNEISEYLNSLLSNNINCEDINYAVTQIENLFVSNAEKSFGFQKQFTPKITHQISPGLIPIVTKQGIVIITLANCTTSIKHSIIKIF